MTGVLAWENRQRKRFERVMMSYQSTKTDGILTILNTGINNSERTVLNEINEYRKQNLVSLQFSGIYIELKSKIEEFNRTGRHPDKKIELTENDVRQNLDQGSYTFNDARGRMSVACGDIFHRKTAVILVAGQSNAANEGLFAAKSDGATGVYNFNFLDGACTHARDPLLGATGEGANFLTRLGSNLIADGTFQNVLLVPVAVGGTETFEWLPGTWRFRRIEVALRRLSDQRMRVTHMIWNQGEAERGATTPDDYRRNLTAILLGMRTAGLHAPIFVAQVSLCAGVSNKFIRMAQRGMVDLRADIHAGPDLDTIGLEDRFDGCHFDAYGLDRAARLWSNTLSAFEP
jgi:Carbohydrate esterase, sialic acid-specific acetylesterase